MGNSLIQSMLWAMLFSPVLSICAQEVTFTLFDTQDGLPSARVTALVQDQQGHLWVGTDVGLSRFNGYSFQTFYADSTYIPAKVNALAVDKAGTVWIGTTAGLSQYRNGKFQIVTTAGLDSISVQCLFVDSSGQIFITSLYQLYVLSTHLESEYIVNQYKMTSPWFVGEGKEGKVWVSSPTHLMLYSNGHLQTVLSEPDKIERGIVGVYEDDQGLLFGTKEDNVKRLNLVSGEIDVVRPFAGYYDDFHALISWRDQTWIIYGWGILKLLASGQELFEFPEPWNIKYVNASYVDQESNFWVGTTEGLLLIQHSLFNTFDKGIESEIYSIYEASDQTVWFGGNRGWVYQMDTLKRIFPWKGPESFGGEIMDITEDQNGCLWLASYWQGLVYWDGSNATRFEVQDISPLGPDIYDIHLDTKENLWLGTTRGLFFKNNCPQDHNFESYNTRGIPDQCDVYQIASHDDFLWVASSCGLFKVTRDQVTAQKLPNLHMSTQIRSIHTDGRHLWVGTLGYGLRCYSYQDDQLHLNKVVDQPDRSILDIVGNEAYIWAGTPNGLVKITNDPNMDYVVFSSDDGFFKEGFAYLRLFLSKNGTLYIATSRGLKTLSQLQLTPRNRRDIIFDQMMINGQPKTLNQEPTELPSNIRTIELSYYYPDLTNSDHLRYQWQMNDQQDWSTWSRDRKIMLYNPKPGTYNVKIRVGKANTILSETNLLFIIKAPWFQNPMVIILLLGILGFLVFLLVRRRDRRIKLQQHLETQRALTMASLESKALRAQMNPHFLFNILNSLQEMIVSGHPEQAQIYLTKFSRLMRMILTISAREYVKIEKELDFISLYLDLERLRFDYPFEYSIQIDPDLLSEEVPVFMVQPLVENAVKHGLLPLEKERKLEVIISHDEQFIEIRVIDNGVGLNYFKKHNKIIQNEDVRALDLLRHRLDILAQRSGLECSLTLNENQNQDGTVATILLPLYPVYQN